MTLDVMSNSPLVSKANTRQFEGETSSFSEFAWGFFLRNSSFFLSILTNANQRDTYVKMQSSVLLCYT